MTAYIITLPPIRSNYIYRVALVISTFAPTLLSDISILQLVTVITSPDWTDDDEAGDDDYGDQSEID